MDKNAREKEVLKKWAQSNHKNEAFLYDPNTTSCFVKRGIDEIYIWEYDFESVSELRGLLEEQWKKDENMKEILTAILAAAIKNKPIQKDVNSEKHSNPSISGGAEPLPMYIYNF